MTYWSPRGMKIDLIHIALKNYISNFLSKLTINGSKDVGILVFYNPRRNPSYCTCEYRRLLPRARV